MAEDGHTEYPTVWPNIAGDDGAISKQSLVSNYIYTEWQEFHSVCQHPMNIGFLLSYNSNFDPHKPHNTTTWHGLGGQWWMKWAAGKWKLEWTMGGPSWYGRQEPITNWCENVMKPDHYTTRVEGGTVKDSLLVTHLPQSILGSCFHQLLLEVRSAGNIKQEWP